MDIRPERPPDHDMIYALTKTAFAPMPYSNGEEAECVNKLRADNDLSLSLVADDGGDIVGHIAFSPVTLSTPLEGWFGLGPVSVKPGRQRSGIGGILINTGLDILRQRGAGGCALIGDPNYYKRFGFIGDGRLTYRNLPDGVVQWLSFSDVKPRGVLTFSPGLE